MWEGKPLNPADCVLSADEKTSIQARRPIHPTVRPAPGRPVLVEHEYERLGAWAVFAAWDVRRAKVHGRCERQTGVAAFERLVGQVMRQEPYRSAPRVFWIMDNGSSHRGERRIARLAKRWPTIIVAHTPVHAGWLNQVEIYFSIVQRKALTPSDFSSMMELEERLLGFQEHYQAAAQPFQWKFTRRDLTPWLLAKLRVHADSIWPGRLREYVTELAGETTEAPRADTFSLYVRNQVAFIIRGRAGGSAETCQG